MSLADLSDTPPVTTFQLVGRRRGEAQDARVARARTRFGDVAALRLCPALMKNPEFNRVVKEWLLFATETGERPFPL